MALAKSKCPQTLREGGITNVTKETLFVMNFYFLLSANSISGEKKAPKAETLCRNSKMRKTTKKKKSLFMAESMRALAKLRNWPNHVLKL